MQKYHNYKGQWRFDAHSGCYSPFTKAYIPVCLIGKARGIVYFALFPPA
jgi:hypothetical protein